MPSTIIRKFRTFAKIIKSRLLTGFFEKSICFFQKNLQKHAFQLQVTIAEKGNELYKPEFLDMVESKWAVIFHGKIYNEECLNFLKVSLKEIRLNSSRIEILVSTYEDNFFEELKEFSKTVNFTLVSTEDTGKMPAPYPSSIAQQIHSFATGMKALSSTNLENCMKIRVDQRVDIYRTIDFIYSYEQNVKQPGDHGRLWGSSYNSYERRLLGVSDMFMAGPIKSMQIYWRDTSVPDCVDSYMNLQEKYDNQIWSKFIIPETFLAARFLDSLGIDLKLLGECNYIFWSQYVGVINATHIRQKWFKTHDWASSNYHSIKWFTSLWTPDFVELTFEKWFLAYGSKSNNRYIEEFKSI